MEVEDWMEQMTLPPTAAQTPNPERSVTVPAPETPTRPEPRWAWPLRLLAPVAVGAGLLWLCYFPLALGWLAWVAVVPLLTLPRSRARPWLIYPTAFLTGLAFYLAALRWMPVADERMYATWAALSIYCAMYFALTIFLV